MNTREIAYSIFEQLDEEELQGFITLFQKAYPPKTDDINECLKAFERMKEVCRYIPELDEKKELAEYREEKYSK